MRRLTVPAALLFALLIAGPLAAQKKQDQPIFTDPAKAGVDYELQGEYSGKLANPDDGEDSWGAQVIALGDGKFRVVGYPGGLPGDGWKKGDPKESAEGSLKDGAVTFKTEEWTATVSKGKLKVTHGEGGEVGSLKKTVRKSSTLGKKPPAGAVVLFDGSSADTFENGKLTDDHLLMANCSSKQKFGDHTLHLEFRTPFKPHARGQARGNSGMYIQSRYEVQVLDSFGLEGKNNECGGIYSISEPNVNMCYPPLTWQTYDYQFKAARYDSDGKKTQNARVTLRHNGVVIHDNLELTHGTPGKNKEGPGPDGLYLQGHGNPVVYRNIWVVEAK